MSAPRIPDHVRPGTPEWDEWREVQAEYRREQDDDPDPSGRAADHAADVAEREADRRWGR